MFVPGETDKDVNSTHDKQSNGETLGKRSIQNVKKRREEEEKKIWLIIFLRRES